MVNFQLSAHPPYPLKRLFGAFFAPQIEKVRGRRTHNPRISVFLAQEW